jgi:Raf kinase inhibitor-like YbhB/YbcL family protein
LFLKELVVSSPVFGRNVPIPLKYSCLGENVNPPLKIDGIPVEAKSLVLIVEDPDAPMGLWIHWVVWNIPTTGTINEDSIPGTEGVTTSKKRGYGGPCPPSGTHRYFFKVYALDTKLDLGGNSQKRDVEKAMESHVLAKGELVGLYSRKTT